MMNDETNEEQVTLTAEPTSEVPADDDAVPVLDHIVIPGEIMAPKEIKEDTGSKQTVDESVQDVHSALDHASERPVVEHSLSEQEQTPTEEVQTTPTDEDNNAASELASAMLFELTDRLHARLSPQISSMVDDAVRNAVIAALSEAGPAIGAKVKAGLEARIEEALADAIAVAVVELIEKNPDKTD